jgi:hypothetical protein
MDRRFEIVPGAEGFTKIRDSWEDLTARNCQARYFHTYSWYRAYANNLEPSPGSLIFVLAYQDDRLEAIFPLQLKKVGFLGFALRVLQAPQHLHLTLHDVVLGAEGCHEGLLFDLLRFLADQKSYKCDAVNFGYVLEDSAAMKLIREDRRLSTTIFPSGHCNSMPVLSEEALPNFISKNLKGNLRKARSKLSKQEKVEFLTTRDPELLPEYFSEFLNVEASGWKGSNGSGTAIKLNESLSAFYSDLADQFGGFQRCEISLLKIDDRVAAGQFGLIVGQTMYLLKIGYAEGFAQFAPGSVLMAHTLNRLNDDSEISDVNLVSDAGWHTSWRPIQQQIYKCCVYRDGLTARLILAYGRGREVGKRMYVEFRRRAQQA